MLLLLACAEDRSSAQPKDTGTLGEDTADSPPPASAAWYVDCAAGDDDADGRTPDTPLRTLGAASALPLTPGDALLLRAGTTCIGTLALSASGEDGAPISVGAWDEGAAPVIDAAGAQTAISLNDTSWLDVGGLELRGATLAGLYASAAIPTAGLTLHDLHVHDVMGGPPTTKLSGLVVLAVTDTPGTFTEVDIGQISAHDTDLWAGILIYAHAYGTDGPRGEDLRIHDSEVHEVGGDGIVVFGGEDALLDHNLAWEVGQATDDSVGTPNGICTWDCVRCTVEHNEAHHVHSPGVDGGAFDIDWATTDNVVQYNYGHDNDGYCVAVFAAEGWTTSGAIVRHNVCIDNAQAADKAFQGEVYVRTWNGGVLGDLQLYGNTVLSEGPWGYPAVVFAATPAADARISNNLFVVRGEWMATVPVGVALDHSAGSPATPRDSTRSSPRCCCPRGSSAPLSPTSRLRRR